MGMGQQKSKGGTSNALAKQVDADGNIKYDVIARYGHAQDKVIRILVRQFTCLLLFFELKGSRIIQNDMNVFKCMPYPRLRAGK